MAEIIQNVGLAPEFKGFEPCAVRGHDVALYTANWFAAYSTDRGFSFERLDPNGLLGNEGETLCCDQRVEYVPRIDTFAWVMLSNEGPFALAVASPDEIRNSRGTPLGLLSHHPRTIRVSRQHVRLSANLVRRHVSLSHRQCGGRKRRRPRRDHADAAGPDR